MIIPISRTGVLIASISLSSSVVLVFAVNGFTMFSSINNNASDTTTAAIREPKVNRIVCTNSKLSSTIDVKRIEKI